MVASLFVPLLLAAAPQAGSEAHPPLFIRAERLIVRPGEERENVSLLVEGGRILQIGDALPIPSGARTIQAEVVCAGFVDPWTTLGLEAASASDLRANAATRTADGLDPFTSEPDRLEALRGGVTSVRTQAGAQASIGGAGTLLRVHDGEAIEDVACVAASIGVSRSGRTVDLFDRVGEVERLASALDKAKRYHDDKVEYRFAIEEWEKEIAEKVEKLEKDFKKAKKDRDKKKKEAEEKDKEFKEEKYKEDKRPSPPKYDEESEILARVVRGEVPLIVEAHRHEEIKALLARTSAFQNLRLVIAGATEAKPFANQLSSRNVGVVCWPGPWGEARPDEWSEHSMDLAAHLEKAGVDVMIGSGGTSDVRDLRMLASTAVGYGLSPEDAFAAITSRPARMLGAAGRLGVVEQGAEADLVLLDGDPVDTTARVRYVVSRGEVVVEP